MNMAASLTEIEQQARALATEERARLEEVILESLQTPPLSDIEAEWAREIEDRVAAFDRGETKTYAAEVCLRKLGACPVETGSVCSSSTP